MIMHDFNTYWFAVDSLKLVAYWRRRVKWSWSLHTRYQKGVRGEEPKLFLMIVATLPWNISWSVVLYKSSDNER